MDETISLQSPWSCCSSRMEGRGLFSGIFSITIHFPVHADTKRRGPISARVSELDILHAPDISGQCRMNCARSPAICLMILIFAGCFGPVRNQNPGRGCIQPSKQPGWGKFE